MNITEASSATGIPEDRVKKLMARHTAGDGLTGNNTVYSYIDYVELKEARQSAKRAHRLALFAIGLSVVLGIVSVVVVWMRITRPTRLDDAQVQQIINAAPEQVELDEDQLQQIVNAGSGQSVTLNGTQVQDVIKAIPQPGRGTGWTAGER